MNLSKHLTVAEFEYSKTAVKMNIENRMNEHHLTCAKLLAEKIFEPIRSYRGAPIKINSGFRGDKLNISLKGSKSSQHLKGEAIDLPLTADEFHFIKDNLIFDQLIWEFGTDSQPQWVHVSYSAVRNRKQVLRAVKVNGKTKYIPFK